MDTDLHRAKAVEAAYHAAVAALAAGPTQGPAPHKHSVLEAARARAAALRCGKRARQAAQEQMAASELNAKLRKAALAGGHGASAAAPHAAEARAPAGPRRAAEAPRTTAPATSRALVATQTLARPAEQQPIVVRFAERREDRLDMTHVLEHAVQQAVERAVQRALASATAPRLQAAPPVLATLAGCVPAAQSRVSALAVAAPRSVGTQPAAAIQHGPPLLTAQSMLAAAQRRAAERPRITRETVVERASRGVAVPQAERQAADVEHETLLLVVLLPMYALAELAGRTVAHVRATPPEQLVKHLLRRTRLRWVATTIYAWRRAWIRLLLWLEENDIEHDGTVDGMTLGVYLDHVDASARARCAARPPPPPGATGKRQTGSCAATAQWSKLNELRRNWMLRLGTEAARARYEPSRVPSQPAIAPSVGALLLLEKALVSIATAGLGGATVPVGNALGGVLFLAYGVSRVEQAQSCYFDGWQDGFLHGVFLLDKHPDPFKRRPRRFWVPEKGLLGSNRARDARRPPRGLDRLWRAVWCHQRLADVIGTRGGPTWEPAASPGVGPP